MDRQNFTSVLFPDFRWDTHVAKNRFKFGATSGFQGLSSFWEAEVFSASSSPLLLEERSGLKTLVLPNL